VEYLFDPFGQQSGAKNDRVGDSEHDKIAVGRDASGRLLNKYDERQRVADHADDDDDRTQVDVQLLVKSVCLYVLPRSYGFTYIAAVCPFLSGFSLIVYQITT